MYENDDIIRMLAKVLKHLEKAHNSPSSATGVQKYYPSQVISVDVNNKPLYWFFNEYEFVDWIKMEIDRIENDN